MSARDDLDALTDLLQSAARITLLRGRLPPTLAPAVKAAKDALTAYHAIATPEDILLVFESLRIARGLLATSLRGLGVVLLDGIPALN